MKLIEVVFLTGAHCVSPVQHATPMTEVFKVQCAVVVAKDTVANTISVTPNTAAENPFVIAAIGRLQMPVNQPSESAPLQDRTTAIAAAQEEPQTAEPASVASEPPEVAQRRAELTGFKERPEITGTNRIKPPPTGSESVDEPPSVTETAAIPEEAEPPKFRSKIQAAKTSKKPKAKAKKQANQCRRSTRPVWYTNKDGRRKYRCLRGSGRQLY